MASRLKASRMEARYIDLANGFDIVISTVPGNVDLDAHLGLLARDGVLVTLTIQEEPLSLSVMSLLSSRRSLAATRSGGIAETRERLDFCAGIVTETGPGVIGGSGRMLACPCSATGRDHPARDLAVSALYPELPRRRETAGRTRSRHLLQNGAALGAEIRSRDRPTAASASPWPSDRWHLDGVSRTHF